MHTKWFFIIVCVCSGLMAADQDPLYITLPTDPESSVTEKININYIHYGDRKSLQELFQESREDNKPSLSIVAYWYRSGVHAQRAYASYEAFKQLRNQETILMQSFYNITFTPGQGYSATACNEPSS